MEITQFSFTNQFYVTITSLFAIIVYLLIRLIPLTYEEIKQPKEKENEKRNI